MNEKLIDGFAIIGIARSGIAAAALCKSMGFETFLSDNRPISAVENSDELIKAYNCEFGGHTEEILKYKTIVLSPGVPGNIPILMKAKKAGIHLISEIELGYRFKPSDAKIIAVTGSNGKSTTVSLIHYILTKAGIRSKLAGNIGSAFTAADIVYGKTDVFVLELSSFQLELLDTFRADAATILNITPDHLTRYNSFDDYGLAKMNIFTNQRNSDLAVINADDNDIARLKPNLSAKSFSLSIQTDAWIDGNTMHIESESYDIRKIGLKGHHNLANIMAVLLLLRDWDIPHHIIEDALATFTTLPHRLEPSGVCNGISFINDSKATNTDSVRFALQAFESPIRIILGGSDKGEDFSVLNPLLIKNAIKVYLIGETSEKMKDQLSSEIVMEAYSSMKEAIQAAYREANSGETVLLSPACASFDSFKNFEDRGNQFKQVVENICKGIKA